MVGKVQKAIQAANLGLNPQNTRGQLFEIPIPKYTQLDFTWLILVRMTQETRETLKKLSRDYLEKVEWRVNNTQFTKFQAKQSMRNHRRTAFDGMKQLIQQKAITKDESRRYEKDFQKVIDDFSKELESMCSAKEKELDRHWEVREDRKGVPTPKKTRHDKYRFFSMVLFIFYVFPANKSS